MRRRRPRLASLPGIAALLAASGCTSSSDGLDVAVENAIDSISYDVMERRHVPGLSVAVVRGGEVVFARGYGRVGTTDSDSAVDTATIFGLGSIKKTVSAAIALRFEERGEWSLSDPAPRWIESITGQGTPPNIEQLLRHVSGLPQDDGVEPVTALAFAPGSHFEYNNSNYDRLDAAYRSLSGSSFTDLVAAEFGEPSIAPSLAMCDDRPAEPLRAMGHAVDGGTPIAVAEPCWIQGTAPDLARWFDALVTGRWHSEDALARLTAPTVLLNGDTVRHGLGVFLRPVRGVARWSNTGHDDGFTAAAAHYPSFSTTIAIAGNSEGLFDPDGLEIAIASEVLGLPRREPFAGSRPGPEPDAFSGRYRAGPIAFVVESGDATALRVSMVLADAPEQVLFTWVFLWRGARRYVGAESPDALEVEFGEDGWTARFFVVGTEWFAAREGALPGGEER